jgi:3-oxoacyl-[acyl-carrier-protein] synthase II
MYKPKRVVITGIGGLCNLGVSAPEIWDNLLKLEVPFRELNKDDHPDYEQLSYRIGGPVPKKFDSLHY